MKKNIMKYYEFYIMLIPAFIFYLIFKYVPMYGVLIAFQDYNFMAGVWKSDWIAFENFKTVFADRYFWTALFNTIKLNMFTILISFPCPIIFALLLNEIKSTAFKRTVQSISYLPHFVSWVIIYGLAISFLDPRTGFINILITKMGGTGVNFLMNEGWWVFVYVFLGIWKEVGWGTILYLSALTSIDPSLYEAAYLDGANRFKCMLHITLPGLKSTIIVLLILNVGKMMNIGFDQPYLFGNSFVSDVSTVLSTYIYEMGIVRAQFSYTTAVGLFQSIVNIILLFAANSVARMLGEDGIIASSGKKTKIKLKGRIA